MLTCAAVDKLDAFPTRTSQADKTFVVSRMRTCFVTGKGTLSNFHRSWSIVNSLSKISSASSCPELSACPSLPRRMSWRSAFFAGTPLNELRPFKDSTSFTSLSSHRSSPPVHDEQRTLVSRTHTTAARNVEQAGNPAMCHTLSRQSSCNKNRVLTHQPSHSPYTNVLYVLYCASRRSRSRSLSLNRSSRHRDALFVKATESTTRPTK